MDKELFKHKMITRVAMAAMDGATDIDQRIEIIVNVCWSLYTMSVRHMIH